MPALFHYSWTIQVVGVTLGGARDIILFDLETRSQGLNFFQPSLSFYIAKVLERLRDN